jgi:hypothetical protein
VTYDRILPDCQQGHLHDDDNDLPVVAEQYQPVDISLIRDNLSKYQKSTHQRSPAYHAAQLEDH